MCDYTEVEYKCGHVRYLVRAWCVIYQQTQQRCPPNVVAQYDFPSGPSPLRVSPEAQMLSNPVDRGPLILGNAASTTTVVRNIPCCSSPGRLAIAPKENLSCSKGRPSVWGSAKQGDKCTTLC